MAAVSVRNRVVPKLTVVNPLAAASACSSAVKSPSGPMQTNEAPGKIFHAASGIFDTAPQ
jgi:hypothetical protein